MFDHLKMTSNYVLLLRILLPTVEPDERLVVLDKLNWLDIFAKTYMIF